ncbi:MAG: hypothetical protein E3J86_12750 [Candidatus Thorarchaeota archaeon]|nr:MAG: hypothetical protein E3J86_12750 [Candidatus Thorarchaeota archaeon]
MAEEKSYSRRKPSKLMRIRDLSAKITEPVRIMGIVVDSSPGSAVIQDIFDDVKKAKKIQVSVEGTLEIKHKYMLIGEVTEKKIEGGKELRLNATIAHNIDTFDIALYKEALEMEEQVTRSMIG